MPIDSSSLKGKLYYGWIVVGALALAITGGNGILTYAFTVFVKPMSADLGWTTGQLTSAYSLSGLVSVVFGPILGRLLDRHDRGSVIAAGLVVSDPDRNVLRNHLHLTEAGRPAVPRSVIGRIFG